MVMQRKTMTKDELEQRRFEGRMMHRYGGNYLGSLVEPGEFPMVMVGNPNQVIKITTDGSELI